MKNKSNILGGVLLIGGLLVVLVLFSVGRNNGNSDIAAPHGSSDISSTLDTSSDEPNVISPQDPHVLGDVDAPVTLIEFGDYQCTFCTKFFKETEPELIEKFVNTGQLKILFVNFPINGVESQYAAQAAECAADQDRFWDYHDRLYNERRGYNVGVFTQDNLKGFAEDLGLDADKFNQCYDSGQFKDKIANDARLAQQAGARGTPAFLLNGRLISGAQPFSVFEQLIAAELNSPNI